MPASNVLAATPGPECPEQHPNAAEFVDAIGDRAHVFQHRSAAWLAVLRFKREFSEGQDFEAALRKRVDELKAFRHPAVAPVRGVERLVTGGELVLLSDRVVGRRLSDLIQDASGPEFAFELIGQVAPALAAMQHHRPGLSHGLLTPDRVIVTQDGQLVLTEAPVAAAMNVLHLPAHRVRTELQVAVVPGTNVEMFDGCADVLQLGFVALSLLLGRRLDAADYPASLQTWLRELEARAADHFAVPPALLDWIERAVQLDNKKFESPQAALDAFAKVRRGGESHRSRACSERRARTRALYGYRRRVVEPVVAETVADGTSRSTFPTEVPPVPEAPCAEHDIECCAADILGTRRIACCPANAVSGERPPTAATSGTSCGSIKTAWPRRDARRCVRRRRRSRGGHDRHAAACRRRCPSPQVPFQISAPRRHQWPVH